MKSDQYWDSLTNFCKQFRNFADDVWKVWRYFGVAAVAGIAYDVGGHPAALAFSGLATGIGILCLITWLLPGMINGLTEKGRNAGPVWKAVKGSGKKNQKEIRRRKSTKKKETKEQEKEREKKKQKKSKENKT